MTATRNLAAEVVVADGTKDWNVVSAKDLSQDLISFPR
jgi:hypothetical protein